MIVFVGGVVAGATGAFFSDTETSTGNTFAAGAIDLGIDNTSYYNGVAYATTTWVLDFDIDDCINLRGGPCLYFSFSDLKPGDFGEDTISLHVNNNESWLCADVKVTEDDDETCNEPELDQETAVGCNEPDADPADGELADQIDFLWWADDGDNVLEIDETPLQSGTLGQAPFNATTTVALADDNENIFTVVAPTLVGPLGGVLTDDPAEILYVGKAWCFGDITAAPTIIDDAPGNSPADPTNAVLPSSTGPATPEDGGYTCNGAVGITNAAQTDKVMLDVAFRAVQARNNPAFQCQTPI